LYAGSAAVLTFRLRGTSAFQDTYPEMEEAAGRESAPCFMDGWKKTRTAAAAA
jgi:hypothetical protein